MATQSASREFIWRDLMTSDIEKARSYYPALFGWEVHEQDMGPAGVYTMWHIGDIFMGGAAQLDASRNLPSYWMIHLEIDDADAAAERTTELGGSVIAPPTDIPDVGRFTVIADPQGAMVSLTTRTNREAPAQIDPKGPGTFAWHELLTTDPEAASRFYSQLVGWEAQTVDMGSGWTYRLFMVGEKYAGGATAMPPEAEAPPAWIPYVEVADINASAQKAKELGGAVMNGPLHVPDVGQIAVTQDPTGAHIAMLQPERPSSP
ncbi:MAG: VOC family protein [Chloroflexota bacterium]